MKFIETDFNNLYIIELEPYKDERGLFFRTYCKKEFTKIGFNNEFVQINQSVNYKKGTLRGLHYQFSPYQDDKLIRCISGKVFDILIDIRKKSNTFLKVFTIELTEENRKMLLVPSGFAHGFLTLEDNSQLIYHHTSFYKPGFEGGINYKDPRIKLKLPSEIKVISNRDINIQFIDNNFIGF